MSVPPENELALEPGPVDDVIAAFHRAGGVVEYVRVARVGEDVAERHRTAAIVALAALDRRDAGKSAEWAATLGRPSTWRPYETDASRAEGSPIDVRAFVGRAFDWHTMRIVSMWSHPTPPAAKSGGTDGYAEAFSDTPYGVNADLEQLTEWFTTINAGLFGGVDDALTIWSWSTDWSSYFDPGLEWWGAFLWTVERDDLPWITAVAASTTD